MTFHFISLHNRKGTMPWASLEYNFITALILPDLQYLRHTKMIRGG